MSTAIVTRCAALLGALILTACSPSVPEQTPQPPPEATTAADAPTTQVLQGTLRGVQASPDVQVYRGIPYAQPPLLERRWQAPASPLPWSGTRSADHFAASCMQPTHASTFVWERGDFEVSEDCLYLNVWRPSEAQRAPVMVWFHGGAHTSGQGHSLIFDGARLAQHGVVLVSINYRLGPLGFLAHPWLAKESAHDSAGNYGLLDKVAALNWVRDNIAQFGGDPGNVTIFGQSAGSQSVCALMASPLARGLMHKAIGQSAACTGPAPAEDANGRARGSRLVEALAINDLETLRTTPPAALLDAAEQTGWAGASRIVVDGWVLPQPPVEIFARGDAAQIPLLLGSLANEGIHLLSLNESLTGAALDAWLQAGFGAQAPALRAAYASEGTPGQIQHAIATDVFMAFGMRRWAQYHHRAGNPVWLYFMDHVPPAFRLYWPDNPDLRLPGGVRSGGAYHSGDLALVFGSMGLVGLGWNDADHRVSDLVRGYWTNFARNGDPNGAGLPSWAAFEPATYMTQRINPDAISVQGVRRERLDLLERALPMR